MLRSRFGINHPIAAGLHLGLAWSYDNRYGSNDSTRHYDLIVTDHILGFNTINMEAGDGIRTLYAVSVLLMSQRTKTAAINGVPNRRYYRHKFRRPMAQAIIRCLFTGEFLTICGPELQPLQ